MAFEQEDEKSSGYWKQPEEVRVQIDAPTAMGQSTIGISDMIAADAAFANMTPEQAKIAEHELETAKMAISRGDFDAVARMQFTEPGTQKLAQQMAAEELGRQTFQKDAMGMLGLGGTATESGSLFSGLGGVMQDATALNNVGNVAMGASAGLGATTLAAAVPIGVKSFIVSDAGTPDIPRDALFDRLPPGVTPGAQDFKDQQRAAQGSYSRAPTS